ncbi:cation:proton antiporter [Streptomyces sp. DT193]|uniref:cation:proton antiporter domain-containing protein n=1 Tax=Streptomyces sp. DT193 TaxID=3393418 RepID=UPI003CEF1F57
MRELPVEAVVLADVALVLALSALMVRLFRRWSQPPVVAEIAAGLMLGPTVLGLLPGDLPSVVFPPEARMPLSAIAQLGLALFMFMAGWELDLHRLRGSGRALGGLAVLSMVVPFCFGAAAALLLYDTQAAPGVDKQAFVLFLATAFSITAFPVLARVIRDRGLSGTRIGSMAMACAAICDVIAWCVLVLVIAAAGAGGTDAFATVVALTLAYSAVMALVVAPLLHRALLRPVRHENRGIVLVLITVGVLLSSLATSWIGVHALFGAFAFGLVMPRQRQNEGNLGHVVAAPLESATSLLLPVFFVVTGLNVDVSTLGWSGVATLAFVLVVAVAGKFAGAMLPARLLRMDWRDAGTFGALMNTRGLTEIIVLGIGRQLGLVSPALFTVMVLMALVTTAMVGPLLRLRRAEKAQHERPITPVAHPALRE